MSEIYTLERPLYDIRVDAYWLVQKTRAGYRFTGPVALSNELLDLLPSLSELERRAAMKHLPAANNEAPYGMEVELVEDDGA